MPGILIFFVVLNISGIQEKSSFFMHVEFSFLLFFEVSQELYFFGNYGTLVLNYSKYDLPTKSQELTMMSIFTLTLYIPIKKYYDVMLILL